MFNKLVSAAPGYEILQVPGLEANRVYRVTSLAQAIRVGQFGSLLKHVVPVNIDPNGMLLRIADRHYTLKNAQEDRILSGSALASGILLAPLFRGTGYDEAQRTYGDFGSDLYVIRPVSE